MALTIEATASRLTSAGTPAMRLTKDEARAYLTTKKRERNQLFVDPRPSKFFLNHQPGLFTWTKDYVTFEFYGAGRIRKLRVRMSDVERAARASVDVAWSFAPDERDRAGASWAQTDGILTEVPGTAHQRVKSALWERAAWNTLNAWCLPPGRELNLTRPTPLLAVADYAERAWARIGYTEVTIYFLPDPDGSPPGATMLHHTDGRSYPSYYGVRVTMTATRAIVVGPAVMLLLQPTSPEEEAYLAVAWDEFAATGKPSAQLRGLKRRKS